MRLSMEIPTHHLEDLSPLVDFDFVIPHKLRNPIYQDFYLARKTKVECILDNGFHELGKPLDRDNLDECYDFLQPDYVISPDNLEDAAWTMDEASASADMWEPSSCAGNVVGNTPEERERVAQHYLNLGFGMVCLPYRKDRLSWLGEGQLGKLIRQFPRIHLLGAKSAHETQAFVRMGYKNISIDTAKPIKWGLKTEYLIHVENWSGGYPEYDTYSEAIIRTPAQEAAVNFNIAYLRKLLTP